MRFISCTTLLVIMLGVPVRGAHAENVVLIKGGAYRLLETEQPLVQLNVDYEERAARPAGLEYQWRFRNNLAVGGDLLTFKNDFKILKAGGHARTVFLSANIKKYFAPTAGFKPFIGAGLGEVYVNVDSPLVTGTTGGIGAQAVLGMELQYRHVGFQAEYKYVYADTEDDNGEEIDVSGQGLFGGLSIHF